MTSPRHFSLKRRIVAVVFLAACVVWALLGITVHRAVLRASAVEFDERLVQQAQVILLYAEHEYAETRSVLDNPTDRRSPAATPEVVYQIWTLHGGLVYRSVGAPAEPLAAIGAEGFRDVRLPSGTWRAYAVRSTTSPLVVDVAEPAGHRSLIASRVRAAVMVPVLLALPLLAILIYVLTRTALRPIQRFADDIAKREPGDLRPLDIDRMPTETLALGEALNSLLHRHGEALARESRFTGDAAHELRTPLAAVRAQAQVAMRARSPEEASAALAKLVAGVDRANRLVTQLLALTRLENGGGGAADGGRSLRVVIDAAVHDLSALAEAHSVRIECSAVPDIQVAEETMYLLLRNLIDNAVRHSPAGGAVRVLVAAAAGRLDLSVTDDGPGIPPELRSRVLERFYRHDAAYAGSGLGLSIVARIVQLFGGELTLESASAQGGLTVKVSIPLDAGRQVRNDQRDQRPQDPG